MRKRDRQPATGWLAEEILTANTAILRLQTAYRVGSPKDLADLIRQGHVSGRRVQREARLWRALESYRRTLREALSIRPRELHTHPAHDGDADVAER